MRYFVLFSTVSQDPSNKTIKGVENSENTDEWQQKQKITTSTIGDTQYYGVGAIPSAFLSYMYIHLKCGILTFIVLHSFFFLMELFLTNFRLRENIQNSTKNSLSFLPLQLIISHNHNIVFFPSQCGCYSLVKLLRLDSVSIFHSQFPLHPS